MIRKHVTELCEVFSVNSIGVPYGGGHINDTYKADKDNRAHLLQRINTEVFKNPDEVMENIQRVTHYLRKKIRAAGGDPDRETLRIVPTVDGKLYHRTSDGNCFRLYTLIDNSITLENVTDPAQFYEAAKAFGRFQNMLADFPAEELHETIAKFHDTPSRLQALKDAVANDSCNRLQYCREEVEYALAQEHEVGIVCTEMEKGTVPCRVTHNDTKLNNVLFDAATEKGLCVVDLDTVMPGSLLYDFGDALRFGANAAAEDETDLDKVIFELDLFKAFTEGFVSELKDSITEKEKELLPFSAKLMTYECGIRFLTDYLNGDTYFKVAHENHNLDRARNQLKLCRDIDNKLDKMAEIVNDAF